MNTAWIVMFLSSLLISVVVLLIYRHVSDQARIARRRNLVIARVLEIRLYQDDVAAVVTAPARVLLACLRYLAASLKPVAVLAVPVTLLVIVSAGWLEYRPLKVNEQTLVTVSTKDGADPALSVSPGLVVETGALRIPGAKEQVWRVRATGKAPVAQITIQSGARRETQRVAIGSSVAWIRPAWGIVHIQYPRRDWRLGTWQPHWLVVFFILMLGWCLLLMAPLHIEM